MKALLAAAILTLGASTLIQTIDTAARPGVSLKSEENESPFVRTAGFYRMKYRAWNALCMDYRPESCEGIAVPKVEIKGMPGNLRGYYEGGNTVFVNRKLRGDEREATMFHEMSHYLDTKLGLNPKMPVLRIETEKVYLLCVSEKRAWDATLEWSKDRKVRGRSAERRGAWWVNWYNHCRPFADRLYPDIYKKPLPSRGRIWFWRR